MGEYWFTCPLPSHPTLHQSSQLVFRISVCWGCKIFDQYWFKWMHIAQSHMEGAFNSPGEQLNDLVTHWMLNQLRDFCLQIPKEHCDDVIELSLWKWNIKSFLLNTSQLGKLHRNGNFWFNSWKIYSSPKIFYTSQARDSRDKFHVWKYMEHLWHFQQFNFTLFKSLVKLQLTFVWLTRQGNDRSWVR